MSEETAQKAGRHRKQRRPNSTSAELRAPTERDAPSGKDPGSTGLDPYCFSHESAWVRHGPPRGGLA